MSNPFGDTPGGDQNNDQWIQMPQVQQVNDWDAKGDQSEINKQQQNYQQQNLTDLQETFPLGYDAQDGMLVGVNHGTYNQTNMYEHQPVQQQFSQHTAIYQQPIVNRAPQGQVNLNFSNEGWMPAALTPLPNTMGTGHQMPQQISLIPDQQPLLDVTPKQDPYVTEMSMQMTNQDSLKRKTRYDSEASVQPTRKKKRTTKPKEQWWCMWETKDSEICGKTFTSMWSIERHIAETHMNVGTYTKKTTPKNLQDQIVKYIGKEKDVKRRNLRTADTPPGFFRKSGTFHIHINGARVGKVFELVKHFESKHSVPCKITFLSHTTEGPQRRQKYNTYQSTTPLINGVESFEFFSTLRFSSLAQSRAPLHHILEEIKEEEGLVVQLEEVVAVIEGGDTYSYLVQNISSTSVTANEVGFEMAPTDPFKIQIAFDLEKRTGEVEEPYKMASLIEDCASVNLKIGSASVFEKKGHWAYRAVLYSSKFEREEQNMVLSSSVALRAQLANTFSGLIFKYWTIVERLYGTWSGPLEQLWDKNLDDIAQWEGNSNFEQVWIIAPQIVGQKDEVFLRNITKNLRNKCKYTYFVHSPADVARLRGWIRKNHAHITQGREINVKENFTVVILEEKHHKTIGAPGNEFIIGNPHSDERQGYKLYRPSGTGICGGELMKPEEVNTLCMRLSPLLDTRSVQGTSYSLASGTIETSFKIILSIVYLSLPEIRKTEGASAATEFELKLDEAIALIVSQHNGTVITHLGHGYQVVFSEDEPKQAWLCAQSIRNELGKSIKLIVVVDFGELRRLMLACGPTWTGEVIVGYLKQLREQLNPGGLILSPSFKKRFKHVSGHLPEADPF
mmetsp:Transcript_10084/g.11183  ORF Transcript_10084/g.11183 Transcript_10084/m.11183 type:complete len:844 (-) Transcript_10084:132-2663(-)